MAKTGLGPHGEAAYPPEALTLTPESIAEARTRGLRVGVAIHQENQWGQLPLKGVSSVLADCGASMTLLGTNIAPTPQDQIAQIGAFVETSPDIVISLPVPGHREVGAAHTQIMQRGVTLVLVEHTLPMLLPGRDYATLVSGDSFQMGVLCAELLEPYLRTGVTVGLVFEHNGYLPFQQREIAFTKWMKANRPDVRIATLEVGRPAEAKEKLPEFLRTTNASGLFALWWEPAALALEELDQMGQTIPVATVDLTTTAAAALAEGKPLVCVAAPQPFQIGVAAATAGILQRLGMAVPSWVSVPAIGVTRDTLAGVYQTLLREEMPEDVARALTPR